MIRTPLGWYDPDIHMFIQANAEADQQQLEALRWLWQNDRLPLDYPEDWPESRQHLVCDAQTD